MMIQLTNAFLRLVSALLLLALSACSGKSQEPPASQSPSSGEEQQCTSYESIINFTGVESFSSITNTSVQLHWTNHSDAKGYAVFDVTGGSNAYLVFVDAPATSAVVTGLVAATSYTFRVKSVDSEFKMDANTASLEVTTLATPPDQLLDTMANAASVYSVRRLSNSYTGKAMAVRRDSDNVVVDIGFDGYDLDSAALNSHLAGANGFVETWYDQSGSGQNLTQSNTNYQPQIIASGTPAGKPTVRFDGVDDYMINSSLNYTARTGFFVYEMITGTQSTSDLAQLWGHYAGSVHVASDARSPSGMSFDGAGSTTADFAYDGGTYSGSFEENPSATGWQMDTTHVLAVEFGADQVLTQHTVGSLFPHFAVGDHQFGGDLSEIIIFSDTKSNADKGTIEASLTSYYK